MTGTTRVQKSSSFVTNFFDEVSADLHIISPERALAMLNVSNTESLRAYY
ncbi:hypothetical protein [Nostoc sp.]